MKRRGRWGCALFRRIYISTISRVARWKSPPRHSARKIVSGLTIQSHVAPSLPPASSVSRVFTRWIPVNIWHVRDAVDTSSSMHMRIVFFFSLSLFLPLLFFSHNRTPRCHERREKFQRDRQICRRHVRARLIRFAANFRKLLDVRMSFVISIREWRDYFGKTLENYYQLWDKAFDGINWRKLREGKLNSKSTCKG